MRLDWGSRPECCAASDDNTDGSYVIEYGSSVPMLPPVLAREGSYSVLIESVEPGGPWQPRDPRHFNILQGGRNGLSDIILS